MEQFGKVILSIGLVLILVGAVVWGLGRIGYRGLPGDIFYRSERITFIFPIVTCVLISVIGTGMFLLWHWLNHRS